LVRLDPAARGTGRARVLAKAGRDIAGDQVDLWMLEEVCRKFGVDLPRDPFWERLLLDEARRVKEELFVRDAEPFQLRPPGGSGDGSITADEWVALLGRRGLYNMLDQVTTEVCGRHAPPDDVLLVGGSTLLPGVYRGFEQRFGRDRVRAWQPFHAVALGACAFAAGAFVPADHIVHDYAIVVRDPATGEKRYETVVPAGTPFPTRGPVWHRQLHPICALGVPERVYKLIVCELGRSPEAQRTLAWDDTGRLHRLAAGERMVVPLNEADPTMGLLDPPHQPGDRSPRLDVRFGVNADRWLVATVFDLRSERVLLDERPVVRLQ
ncbi:MAG: Hsp70 family protein, partial [Myxococcota bacterium]